MNKSDILSRCEALEDEGKIEEIVSLLDGFCSESCNDADMHYYYGRILKKQQRFGDALNAYNRALEIDPDHTKAKAGIFLVNSILSIENNLYYENTYTDEGMYDI